MNPASNVSTRTAVSAAQSSETSKSQDKTGKSLWQRIKSLVAEKLFSKPMPSSVSGLNKSSTGAHVGQGGRGLAALSNAGVLRASPAVAVESKEDAAFKARKDSAYKDLSDLGDRQIKILLSQNKLSRTGPRTYLDRCAREYNPVLNGIKDSKTEEELVGHLKDAKRILLNFNSGIHGYDKYGLEAQLDKAFQLWTQR